MTVKVIALITLNPNAAGDLAEYQRITTPLLEAVGAKIVQQFEVTEAVVGAVPSKYVMIVEYPSRDAVERVFDSPEYETAIPFRDRAFRDYQISIVTG